MKSSEYRKFINIQGEKMRKKREKQRQKNETKIKFLMGKRKKELFKLPGTVRQEYLPQMKKYHLIH
jgi:hypothetical protein